MYVYDAEINILGVLFMFPWHYKVVIQIKIPQQ